MKRVVYALIWQVCLIGLVACEDNKTYQEYYSNGTLRVRAELKGKVLDGAYREYFPNGKLKFTCMYRSGLIEGESYTYYESGNKQEHKHWHHGKLNGIVKGYYEDGRVNYLIPYTNNRRQGRELYYYSNGRLQGEYYRGDYYWIHKDTLLNGILWYREYDSLGNQKKIYHVVKVKAEKEPTSKTYRFQIKLEGADYEKMDVYIGGYDENYHYIGGRQDTVRSDKQDVTYLYKPQKKGKQLIRGVIRDYKERPNSKGGRNIWESNAYFTYELTVD